MKSSFIFSVVLAAAAAGCATQPETAETRLAAENAKTSALKEHCIRDTGSRIKRPADEAACARPGTSYSKEELERTGAISPAEALHQLDPRL